MMLVVEPEGSDGRKRVRRLLYASARANAEAGCSRANWIATVKSYGTELVDVVGEAELERVANCVHWKGADTPW